jgi:pimeloyl-ACP methyl ester carboxylesterase
MLRVGVRPGDNTRPPLLLFNGIGASIELVVPFLQALQGPEAIVFDVPGVGGSPAPTLPYRPSTLARLSARLLDQLGHQQVDVLGVSWGGALAQQFAFQHGERCRRLVLAATSPGHLMVPGRLTVLLKLATPRRYKDADYMKRIAGDIYGGALRGAPERGVSICAMSAGRATTAITCSCSPASAGQACPGCACCRSRPWSCRAPTIRSCRSPTAASWRASFRMRASSPSTMAIYFWSPAPPPAQQRLRNSWAN